MIVNQNFIGSFLVILISFTVFSHERVAIFGDTLYPDYTGSINVRGSVAMWESMPLEPGPPGIRLRYAFSGLETNVTGGWYIHSGTTCDDVATVGGLRIHNYASDSSGNAMGEIDMANFTAAAVDGLVVVVSAENFATKVACSKLLPFSRWYAHISDYPGSQGGISTGYVQVQEDHGGINLMGVFSGLSDLNATGGWHIHSGTTCDDAEKVGGHFKMPGMTEDPWINITYASDTNGDASVNISMPDFTIAEVINKPIVVHNNNGDKVGCGVILPVPQSESARIYDYPLYEANTGTILHPVGVVHVSQEDGAILLSYKFSGLEASASGGWHIHTGKSCVSHDVVYAHYWPRYLGSEDPQAGNTYASDEYGVASGTFRLAGFSLFDVMNRAIVVHSSTGVRIGCGLILPDAVRPQAGDRVATFEAGATQYPDYPGTIEVQGSVAMWQTNWETPSIRLRYKFSGLEADASGGWHIHSGTTCNDSGTVGGHFEMPGMTEDPWIPITYASDSSGNAMGEIDMENFTANAVCGLVVVVHESGGTKVACSKLVPFSQTEWTAEIGDYPGTIGGPRGLVTVTETEHGIHLAGVFSDLEFDSMGGWHIHSGTTCDDAEKVGGHFQMPGMVDDPWIPIKYTADAEGKAHEDLAMVGFTMAEVINKPIVIHDKDGDKIGCGVILGPVPDSDAATDAPVPDSDAATDAPVPDSDAATGSKSIDEPTDSPTDSGAEKSQYYFLLSIVVAILFVL